MNRNIIKALAGCLLATTLVFQTTLSFGYTKIYETKSAVETYADGVTHETVKIFTSEGWINMNVMRVDLRKNVEMTVITDTVLSSRDTLTNLVKKNNEDQTIVAAINSDFFDTNSNSTMGNLMLDGRLLSTSVGSDAFASFNIGTNGLPYIAYLNAPKNEFSNGTYTKQISYFNKPYLAYNRTIYYDNVFNKKSYGNTLGVDIVEILVVDDVIKEIRRKGEPFVLPENGYVMASVGKDIAEMIANYKVGDQVSIKYDVNFRFTDLSIGGGAQIVKGGKIVPTFSHDIAGRHPRSGVGISKDRRELIMVTVDGRTQSFRGVTQKELANLLIGLGAHDAINLDGGGSTQMVAKSPWNTKISTLNYPSDQVERRMYTALAIEKVLSETPELRTIKIDMTSGDLLVGSDMRVTIQANDSNYNPLTVDASQVAWSVSGVKGVFEAGRFVPQTVGKGIITAEYNGLKATRDIVVRNNGIRLIVSPTVLKADVNQEKAMTFSVLTEDGKTVPISSKAVKAVVPPSLGTFDYDRSVFIAGDQSGQGYITCSFDGLEVNVPIGVGGNKQLYYDFETPTATFDKYPLTVVGQYLETTENARKGASGKLIYDFSKSTDTRAAYMVFKNPVTLPKDTTSIGMWVYGDEGNDHWLRAKVVDSEGESTNITLARHVDWDGWKYVTADLPTSLKAPFVLERVYLAETDALKLDAGYILIDQIEAITSQTITVTAPPEKNRVKKASDYKLPASLNSSSKQVTNFIYFDKTTKTIDAFMKANRFIYALKPTAFAIENKTDSTVIKMINSKSSIRTNGYGQWTELLKFVDSYKGTKPVVIQLSDVFLFNDSLERDLFQEQLLKLTDKGIEVAVVMPTNNKTFGVTKLNGAWLLRVPRSGDTVNYLSFSIVSGKIVFQGK